MIATSNRIPRPMMKPLPLIATIALLTAAGCAEQATPPEEFTCKAEGLWQNTGIMVHQGDRLAVTYENGQWTADIHNGLAPPAGNPLTPARATDVLPSANRSALIGRVGDAVFLIGNGFDGVIAQDGRLYCVINTTITASDAAPFLPVSGSVTMRAWVTRAHPVCSAGATVAGVCL